MIIRTKIVLTAIIAVMFAGLVLIPAPAFADSIGNHDVTFVGYRFDYPNAGQSTWFYTVTSGRRPAISHVTFAQEGCITLVGGGVWSGSVDMPSMNPDNLVTWVNPDPTTQTTGIKFDREFEDNEIRNYYYIVTGADAVSANNTVVLKGSTSFVSGATSGPQCEQVAQPLDAGLDAQIQLLPYDDPGLFEITMTDQQGAVVANGQGLGHGAIVRKRPAQPGRYRVDVDGSEGTTMQLYTTAIECSAGDGEGRSAVIASCTDCTSLEDITVPTDEIVTCTVTNINAQPPLAVTITHFEATCQQGAPLVEWATDQEIDTLGFNLYSGASADGWDTQINTAMIPAQNPGGTTGGFYQWLDTSAQEQTRYYWLQDVDLNGVATMHGPVSVTCLAPTAVRLNTMSADSGETNSTLGWAAAFAALTMLAGLVAWKRQTNAQ